jgi:hypothetical protein
LGLLTQTTPALLSPNRDSDIPGLQEGGVAANLRHALTDFGSAWRGLDAEPQPYNENSNRSYGMPYGLTPGQAFDAADVGIMTTSPFRGGTGPLGWNVPAFGALDVALSAGTSKPEEFAGRTAGAVVATAAGIAGYYGGKVAGGVVGGILGGMVAGPPGAVAGEYVVSFLGSMIIPFAIDPFTRRISRPINRLVEYSKLKVNFGGGYRDSAPAYTLRMKAEQEMRGSLLNNTQWLGKEGQLCHG